MTDKRMETHTYRNCYIVEYKDGDKTTGVDVVDAATGR